MSFKFNNAVQTLQPLSGHTVRLILWYLADHANDQGVAYASYETLMRACQIKSRTTINEGLKELEALKILRKIHRPNQCVKYVLDLSVIQSLGLTGVNLGESELNVGTLGDTPDSTPSDTTEFPSEGPAVRSTILSGVSTIEHGSTLGDTLSNCTSISKEIHQTTNLVSSPEKSSTEKLNPEETKMFQWAETHSFWKDFTPTLKGFRNGALASDSFHKSYANAMRKTKKNPAYGSVLDAAKIASDVPSALHQNPAHAGTGFLAKKAQEQGHMVTPPDPEEQRRQQEEKQRLLIPYTCVHCKTVGNEIFRHGYCADCAHHDPDRGNHWCNCKCDRCLAHRAAHPFVKKAAKAAARNLVFDEDPL